MTLFCSHLEDILPNSTSPKTMALSCSLAGILLSVPVTIVNSLLIYAFAASKERSKPCMILLLNLAIIDLLTGIVICPTSFAINFKLSESRNSCHIMSYMSPVFFAIAVASLSTINLVALERYISVFHPYYHNSRLSARKVAIWVAASWMSAISAAAAATVPDQTKRMVDILDLVFAATIAFVASSNLYIYMRIIQQAKRIQLQVRDEASRYGHACINTAEKRLVYLGALIIISMLICYVPTGLLLLLRLLGYIASNTLWCHGGTLAAIDSLLNPIITCMFCPDIRRKVLKTLRCKFTRQIEG